MSCPQNVYKLFWMCGSAHRPKAASNAACHYHTIIIFHNILLITNLYQFTNVVRITNKKNEFTNLHIQKMYCCLLQTRIRKFVFFIRYLYNSFLYYFNFFNAARKFSITPFTSSSLQVPTDKRYQLESVDAPNA